MRWDRVSGRLAKFRGVQRIPRPQHSVCNVKARLRSWSTARDIADLPADCSLLILTCAITKLARGCSRAELLMRIPHAPGARPGESTRHAAFTASSTPGVDSCVCINFSPTFNSTACLTPHSASRVSCSGGTLLSDYGGRAETNQVAFHALPLPATQYTPQPLPGIPCSNVMRHVPTTFILFLNTPAC